MSEFERGFRAGVEAAAGVVEDMMDHSGMLTRAIRSLAPPSPEPATLRYWNCPRCSIGYTEIVTACCYCGTPAPAPGPSPLKTAVQEWGDWIRENCEDPNYCGGPAPAPGPERCGHEFRDLLHAHEEGTARCKCGAEWRDDGQGWRRP